jgi:cytochrome c oxidase cbb3-type subunit 1
MSAPSPSSTSLARTEAVASTSAPASRLSAAEIDASCRWPLLFFFTSAVLWLVLGTFLAFIAAIQLHKAGFLADYPWLTLGRIRPAGMNCFLYGFASQAGIGVLLWLLCRLGGVKLLFTWPLLVAWKLWNLGLTVGVIAILAGASTGFEWLEMPPYAAGILFVAYALIGLCALATFSLRREGELFPSQWYLVAALFWFPWLYSAGNYLLVLDPVRGTLQAAVNAWFTGNFAGLWLGPIALAGIFYFLPKLTGQPLYSRELAAFGFWTLTFFTNFAGLTSLIGGPVPRWMTSVTVAANVCLLAPLVSNAINWHWTHAGNWTAWKGDFVLRFVIVGAFCYLLHGLVSAVECLPQVGAVTQFTYAVVARDFLVLHGFIGLVLFGCMYFIVPHLVQGNWPKPQWIRVHFLCSTVGVAILFLGLTMGGVIQGFRLADPRIPFLAIVKGTIPFVGLSTLGVLLLLVGQCAFLANLGQLLRVFCQPICQSICAELCVPSTEAQMKS